MINVKSLVRVEHIMAFDVVDDSLATSPHWGSRRGVILPRFTWNVIKANDVQPHTFGVAGGGE